MALPSAGFLIHPRFQGRAPLVPSPTPCRTQLEQVTMSVFDATSFMQNVVKAELDTRFPVIPEGEYLAQVKKIDMRQVEFRKIQGSGVSIDIQWEVMDDGVRDATKMEHPFCRQSFLLDLVKDSAPPQLDLSEGRNIRLGQLLAACGLNSKKGWSI